MAERRLEVVWRHEALCLGDIWVHRSVVTGCGQLLEPRFLFAKERLHVDKEPLNVLFRTAKNAVQRVRLPVVMHAGDLKAAEHHGALGEVGDEVPDLMKRGIAVEMIERKPEVIVSHGPQSFPTGFW